MENITILGWGFPWCLPWHDSVPFTPGLTPGRRRAGSPGGHCHGSAVAVVEPAVKKQASCWTLHCHSQTAHHGHPQDLLLRCRSPMSPHRALQAQKSSLG